MSPIQRFVTCASPRGLHRLAYLEWPCRAPAEAGPVDTVLCVHGLTRNAWDFAPLAERLSRRWRVIAPDMIGRGASDRVADPELYNVPQYIADCITLIARLDRERIAWLGTSMGGLIGMSVASLPGSPVARLVLNDIGPVVAEPGRQRIGCYVGHDPAFDSFEAGELALRALMVDFGPHTDAEFRHLSAHYLVEREGKWRYHYDPAIAIPFRASLAAPLPDLWPMWDAIRVPTLLLRGASSDVLSSDDAQAMTERGPRARLVTFEGVGHAPTLIRAAQIDPVEAFLES